jgi:hypothetical protein
MQHGLMDVLSVIWIKYIIDIAIIYTLFSIVRDKKD